MVKNKNLGLVLSILKSPSFVVFVISLLILTIQIIFVGKYRPFNSDDLYWQQVVKTWKPFNGETLYLGTKDIFIEQVPFFYLTQSLFNASRKLLIAETILLTATSFTFFYFSSLYFLKKLKVRVTYFSLLPFIWLASFGYPLVQNYLNVCWRTFEVGLSFLTFVLVASILNGDFKPLKSIWTKLLALLSMIFIGIIIYSDPYYIFFTVLPLLLFTGILYLLKKIKLNLLVIIFGGAALSMIFAKITEIISTKAGVVIVFDTPSIFVNFDDIVTNIVSSLHGLLIVFGADFFGRPAFKISTVILALNAALLSIIIYKAFQLRHVLKRPYINQLSLPQLWVGFFGCMLGFVFLLYTVTTLVTVGNYRFYIIFIYCAITLFSIVLATSKNNMAVKAIAVLLILASLFNLHTTLLTKNIVQQPDVRNNVGNSLNYQIIDAVRSEGLTKGYAIYWQANVNTYFSNNRIAFLPSLCSPDGKTKPFKWLVDGGQFKRAAEKSFYLIDPDITEQICSQEQAIVQFGQPDKIVMVQNKTILIYGYDITNKIQF